MLQVAVQSWNPSSSTCLNIRHAGPLREEDGGEVSAGFSRCSLCVPSRQSRTLRHSTLPKKPIGESSGGTRTCSSSNSAPTDRPLRARRCSFMSPLPSMNLRIFPDISPAPCPLSSWNPSPFPSHPAPNYSGPGPLLCPRAATEPKIWAVCSEEASKSLLQQLNVILLCLRSVPTRANIKWKEAAWTNDPAPLNIFYQVIYLLSGLKCYELLVKFKPNKTKHSTLGVFILFLCLLIRCSCLTCGFLSLINAVKWLEWRDQVQWKVDGLKVCFTLRQSGSVSDSLHVKL